MVPLVLTLEYIKSALFQFVKGKSRIASFIYMRYHPYQYDDFCEYIMENQIVEDKFSQVKVLGEFVTQLPPDLYIPPDAMRVLLDAFEGPLDLLLYLIRKHNIDILDIPIAEITRQYVDFVNLMREVKIELAAEYLVMAAMLAEIKSRMLLPRPSAAEVNEEDPRAELVRRLQEYERYKQAAEDLDNLQRVERDTFVADAAPPPIEIRPPQAKVDLEQIFDALKEVYQRARLNTAHLITAEPLSIRERMSIVLSKVKKQDFTVFTELFTYQEGRMGVVVTLIAILELIRQSTIELVQSQAFAPIYVRTKGRQA